MPQQADETINHEEDSSASLPDATAESSTATGAVSESPTEPGAKKRDLARALDEVVLEEPKETTAQDSTEESPTPPGTESEKDADSTAPKDDKAAKTESHSEADALFHKRPEWSELTKVLGEDAAKKVRPLLRRVLERETHLTKELGPMRELVSELRSHTGDEQGFTTMRHIVRSYAKDPGAAVPILEGMLQDARKRAGLEVSSDDLRSDQADLQKRYEEGEIDQKQFNREKTRLIEVEKARKGRESAERQLKEGEEARQREANAGQSRAIENALNQWEEVIRQRDPDFGDVTSESDPRHGESIADQVFDGLQLLQIRKQGRATSQELLGEVERIYKLARGRLAAPAQRQARVVTSQGSSVTGKPKPRSIQEAMDQVRLV